MKPDWYTANDWSKLPAGGNSLRQIFVRLEDWEAVLAESERALSVCSKGFDAMCKRAIAAEARICASEAALRMFIAWDDNSHDTSPTAQHDAAMAAARKCFGPETEVAK